MDGWAVWWALKTAAKRAGLDAQKFGAHSLRAGFVTASVDAGADVFDIMAITGHKSVENLGLYVRKNMQKYPLRAAL
jgi:site-specific recombinase XerD